MLMKHKYLPPPGIIASFVSTKPIFALLAKKAKKEGIKKVFFDRGGYLYHGRVKAFAESAREAGLNF